MRTEIGLSALGSAAGEEPCPLLIDTGAVLTTQAPKVEQPARVAPGSLSLYDAPPIGTPVLRAQWNSVPILQAALAPVGVDASVQSYCGILGGDLLQRYSVALDYAGPSMTLAAREPDCSCQLAAACFAVLPFTLAGGRTIALGDQVHRYPATRVTLDACLETVADPTTSAACLVPGLDGTLHHNRGYEIDRPPGVDVRLLVATGFPGLLLGASAWDRLRGQGSAARLLAGPTVSLQFAGGAAGVTAARATLGGTPTCTGDACAAVVLVGREGLLGACGELARSRRLRWSAANREVDGDRKAPPDCARGDNDRPVVDPGRRPRSCLQALPEGVCGDPNRCNDVNQSAAGYVELTGAIDVFVVDDIAPVLLEVNLDVRPLLSDVEGVAGSELLARLAMRIDYPRRRVIARCSGDPPVECQTFPRFACPNRVNDCGPRGIDGLRLCNPPSSIAAGGPICTPSPDP